MKTLIFALLTTVVLCFAPKNTINFIGSADKYCAKLKDGIIVVIHNDTEIKANVKLNDGSVVQPDGGIIDKDGAKRFLKDGECIDKSGKIIYPD